MLSAFLLGAAKKSESELDRSLESIFKTSVSILDIESSKNLMASLQANVVTTSPRPAREIVKAQSQAPNPSIKKRKRHDKEEADGTEKRAKKKSKQEQPSVDVSAVPSTLKTRSKKMQASSQPPISTPTKNLKGSPAKSLKGPQNDTEKGVSSLPMYQDEQEQGQRGEDAGSSSGDEHKTEPLVHETITNGGGTPSVVKPKRSVYVLEGETKEQRNARTVFIGNVPMEAAKSKVIYNDHCTDAKLTFYSALSEGSEAASPRLVCSSHLGRTQPQDRVHPIPFSSIQDTNYKAPCRR